MRRNGIWRFIFSLGYMYDILLRETKHWVCWQVSVSKQLSPSANLRQTLVTTLAHGGLALGLVFSWMDSPLNKLFVESKITYIGVWVKCYGCFSWDLKVSRMVGISEHTSRDGFNFFILTGIFSTCYFFTYMLCKNLCAFQVSKILVLIKISIPL